MSQQAANPQEAEIWTLCRIFKRNVSHKKYTPDWRDLSTKLTSKKCNMTIDHQDRNQHSTNINGEAYISFGASNICYEEKKPNVLNHITKYNNASHIIDNQALQNASHHQFITAGTTTTTTATHSYNTDPFASSYSDIENQDFFNENWEEFRSVIQLALDPSFM